MSDGAVIAIAMHNLGGSTATSHSVFRVRRTVETLVTTAVMLDMKECNVLSESLISINYRQ